jgi:hypothetical protein
VLADQPTVQAATGTGPVVTFATSDGLTSVLNGFTIQNGLASCANGGGILIQVASPTLTNNIITDGQALEGVGVWVDDGSPLRDLRANLKPRLG